ncbi:MAG: polysaccharide pyruvyl transferase family protein [Candidatus Helarchaeota archaeon]
MRNKERHLKFLIGGVHFGGKNVGDEAILEGIVNVLRSCDKDCQITALTDQPKVTSERLKIKTFKYYFINTSHGKINRLLRIASRIVENLLQAYLVIRADVVICGGATILSDSPSYMLRLASWGIFADKILVYFPGGMNPGNPESILRKIVSISKEFDLFMVRDNDTKKRLLKAGCDSDFIKVTIDPAFNLNLVGDIKETILERLEISNGRKKVGIGISIEPDCREYNHPTNWSKVADFIIENFDSDVVFLPNNTEKDKDLKIMREVYEIMNHKNRAFIIDLELTPKEMISAISTLEMMVSSRMHQLMFSSLCGVPFVGISRSEKIDSFLNNFDMSPAISIKDFDLEKIYIYLKNTWEKKDNIKKLILKKRNGLIKKALETENLMKDLLTTIEYEPKIGSSINKRIKSFFDAFFMRN